MCLLRVLCIHMYILYLLFLFGTVLDFFTLRKRAPINIAIASASDDCI